MPPRENPPHLGAINVEIADTYFLSLLSGRLTHAIYVPRDVRLMGGLSLKNLAILTAQIGRSVDSAGHTRTYAPMWLPGIEVQSHTDKTNGLAQVALKGFGLETEKSLIVDKYIEHGLPHTRALVDNKIVLEPVELSNPGTTDMLRRRADISQAAQEFITEHVFQGRR